jgi:hypothetical protein
VVASTSAGLSKTCFLAGSLSIAALACVEGGNLAVSAGAPVSGALQGRITRCGDPVAGAQVLLLVQQDQPEQARPVDARIGPVTTSRGGEYLVEVAPAFAVPGPATVQLRITADGITQDIPGRTLELRLGLPARDTSRLDADLVAEPQC